MTDLKIAVVTGANRGLGLETCRQLAQAGFHVVMTARNKQRGAAALEQLQADKLSVEMRGVDVTRTADARSLAEYLRDAYGKVDVLINNAGVLLESQRESGDRNADPLRVAPTVVMETLNTNTLGALRLIQALAPLLPDGGRIVNVSSGMGALTDMDGGYLGYRMSKAGMNVITRVMAEALADRNVLVNSVCPGWVRTELGSERAPRSPAEGAAGIVWAATSPELTGSGGFYRDGKALAW